MYVFAYCVCTFTSICCSLQGGSSDLLHGSGKSPTSWDTRVFISCIQSLHPSLNWREVVQSFDYPGFLVPSPDALSLIVTAYNQVGR